MSGAQNSKTDPLHLAGDLNRREFLGGASLATVATMMGGVPLLAADAESAATVVPAKAARPPVNCAVIGLGMRGRDLLTELSRLPSAPVLAVCDTYEPLIDRARRLAANAEGDTDYRRVLARKDVQAVFIATPTHQHRELVEAALAAGKHVYCEMPLAHTLEDARAIAQAARKHPRSNFQCGLQRRSDAQMNFVFGMIRNGIAGSLFKARAQWARKTSWRRISAKPERTKEMNWRLYNSTSTGLVGELGVHQLDLVSWMLAARPLAVSGFGALQLHRDDGRETLDTVQAVFEFPNRVQFYYEATLANSFEAEYEALYGTDATIVLRGTFGWLFKEADAPLQGWEASARKDSQVAYNESGIVLRADASKGKPPSLTEPLPALPSATLQAVGNFVANTHAIATAIEDFEMAFDAKDQKALAQYLDDLKKTRAQAAGWREGYEATVTAIKANEAIVKGTRIAFSNEWFEG